MGVIMKRGINYTGSEGIELTQAEYDALSTEEKNNGTTYFVTDSSGGAIYKNSINYTGDALPDGGTTGQVLMKKSSVSGDVKWGDVGGSITVDNYFSTTSENPVQNKVITAEVESLDLRIIDLADEMAGARNSIAKLDTSIGNMSSLSTSAKTTIVEAINEIANKGGGGTVAFNDVTGRPLYGGMPMTSATIIPYVSNHLPELSNSNTKYTMGGNVTGDLDMELTIDASNNNATLRVYDTVIQDIVASKTLQGQLTAGTNITIDANNVISASGGGGTVDQSYNAYSTNAQSGTAVAEAIDDMASYSADTTTAIYQGIVAHGNDSLAFWLDTDTVDVTMASPSVYYKSMTLPTKGYVDGAVGNLTALTTTDKTSAVGAINELDAAVKGLGEPFRVKNWASTFDISIPFCTEDIANSSIPKIVFSIDAVEGAEYQIVGMIAYEIFDAASGGNRINCWPVCQFTGNGQKELSVRWVCAGTTRKAAKRINAWVLLKHR